MADGDVEHGGEHEQTPDGQVQADRARGVVRGDPQARAARGGEREDEAGEHEEDDDELLPRPEDVQGGVDEEPVERSPRRQRAGPVGAGEPRHGRKQRVVLDHDQRGEPA